MLFSVRDTASKSEVGSDRRQHLMSVSGLQTHTCTPKRVHMCSTHTYTHTNFKMVTKLKPCKACGGTQCDGPAPTRKGWGPWIYPSWPRGTTSPTLLFSFLTVVIKSSNVSSFSLSLFFLNMQIGMVSNGCYSSVILSENPKMQNMFVSMEMWMEVLSGGGICACLLYGCVQGFDILHHNTDY